MISSLKRDEKIKTRSHKKHWFKICFSLTNRSYWGETIQNVFQFSLGTATLTDVNISP